MSSKSSGSGAVQRRCSGIGSVGRPADRSLDKLHAHGKRTLDVVLDKTLLRVELNGEVTRRLSAFDAATEVDEARLLYVPFTVTTCPVAALVLCRRLGLIESKLAAMDDFGVAYTYLTNIVARELEN